MMKRNPVSRYSSYIILFLWAALSLISVLHHEPWRDELQAWLISRELGLYDLFYQMRYEGHFALWSLLLYPFAHYGGSVVCMNIIAWGCMLVAAWLLLRYSRFAWWVSVLILFSFPFFYYFTAVARPYALIPPILFALATLYKCETLRQKYLYCILLGLLAHTHVYMEGMVGVLLAVYIFDHVSVRSFCAKHIFPPLITLLLIAGAAFQVMPALSLNLPSTRSYFTLNRTLAEIESTVLLPAWNIPNAVVVGALLALGIFMLIRARKGFNPRVPIILTVSIVWQLYLSANVYGISLQRTYLYIFIIAFVLWIDERRTSGCASSSLCGVLVFLCLLTTYRSGDIWRDFTGQYSNVRQIAQALQRDAPVYVDNMTKTVAAYNEDVKLLSLHDGKPMKLYMPHTIYKKEPMRERVDSSKNGKIYYIRANVNMANFNAARIEMEEANAGYRVKLLIPKKGETQVQETFFLYEITRKR